VALPMYFVTDSGKDPPPGLCITFLLLRLRLMSHACGNVVIMPPWAGTRVAGEVHGCAR
jgi:hypothetical protein